MGAFLEEPVKKYQTVWVFNPLFDLIFSQEQVKNMSKIEKELIINYGYLDTQQFNGWWVFPTGNDRFTNHSDTPNTIPIKQDDCQYIMVASEDLEIGSELTCNYSEYEMREM